MSEKIKVGGTFPGDPKPNVCYVCEAEPVVATQESIFGQLLFGLCKKHLGTNIVMVQDEGPFVKFEAEENQQDKK